MFYLRQGLIVRKHRERRSTAQGGDSQKKRGLNKNGSTYTPNNDILFDPTYSARQRQEPHARLEVPLSKELHSNTTPTATRKDSLYISTFSTTRTYDNTAPGKHQSTQTRAVGRCDYQRNTGGRNAKRDASSVRHLLRRLGACIRRHVRRQSTWGSSPASTSFESMPLLARSEHSPGCIFFSTRKLAKRARTLNQQSNRKLRYLPSKLTCPNSANGGVGGTFSKLW